MPKMIRKEMVQQTKGERMSRTMASRKYQLTINNPIAHGYSHEVIKANLNELAGCLYWCMCDEIGGETSTPHTHVYCAFQNPKEFITIQRRFYGAHIEIAHGTHQQNRAYLRKDGKWENDVKHGTIVPNTFEESGELPAEPDARIKQSEAVFAMIEHGASNAEILRKFPSSMNHLPRIEQARQVLLEEEFRNKRRDDLFVSYLWGEPGTGKTRNVLDKHGYQNVYRVTDYEHPFDGYRSEDVLLLDEFRSQLPFSLLLNVLDIYPLMLPCRYANRVACYTKVYIVSNIPLERQYPNVQQDNPASYRALLRRIHQIYQLDPSRDPDEPF